MKKEVAKLPPLLDLTLQYQDITSNLIRCEGEISDELEIKKDLNKSQIMEKLDTYHYVDENLANSIKRLQLSKKKIDAALKHLKSKREFLKSRLNIAKETLGNLIGHMGEWREQKNPPKLEITSMSSIPAEYFVVVLDEKKLRLDLMAGKKVVGAEIKQGTRLKYKEKI